MKYLYSADPFIYMDGYGGGDVAGGVFARDTAGAVEVGFDLRDHGPLFASREEVANFRDWLTSSLDAAAKFLPETGAAPGDDWDEELPR